MQHLNNISRREVLLHLNARIDNVLRAYTNDVINMKQAKQQIADVHVLAKHYNVACDEVAWYPSVMLVIFYVSVLSAALCGVVFLAMSLYY